MRFPFPGIGIVFDIEGLGGGYYGYRALQIFMKHLDPKRLSTCILVLGDTAATLNGKANEYCTGIYGMMLDINYIRETFENINDSGLASVHRRFIEKFALDAQPFPILGRIDGFGRLVTEHWMRTDHDLCKEMGWGYCPEKVPGDLDKSLRTELEELCLHFE